MPLRSTCVLVRAAIAAAICVACFTAVATASASAPASGTPFATPYPRLAMWWPDTDSATTAQLARYDWIALGPWDDPAVATAIHAAHPSEVVANATNACEIDWDPDSSAASGVNDDIRPIPTSWMLTQVGSTLTSGVTTSATTLHVSATSGVDPDGAAFNLFEAGDIVVLGPELAEVTAVNGTAKTLTVRRGVVKAATAHSSGTRVAATVAFWPGSVMMDLTSACPRVTVDAMAGPESWAEYNARIGAKLVADTDFDALLVDRSDGDESWLVGNSTARSIDPSRTNEVPVSYDGFDGAWNAGLLGYELRLRSLLPTTPIFGNWAYPNYGVLNGNNFEGFPNADPSQYPWGPSVVGPWQDRGSYFDWLANAQQPNLTTIETYEDDGGPDPTGDGSYDNPFTHAGFKPNYRKMRFGLTTALMGDGFFSYEINTNGHGSLGLMWFDEYTGSGRGQGFLGQPLAPGARIADTPATPDLLSGDGAFDTASQTAKWEFDVEAPALASAARESTTTHAGAGALRVSVTNATGTDWHVAETHAAPMKAGSDDTLSFWARADHPRTLHAWTQQTHDPYNDWADFGSAAITTSWQHFVLTGNSGGTDVSAQLQLGFGETTGTIYLDDVRLQSGSPEVWRRRFTGGAAIVNATAAPAKASLGGLYRLLKGTQAPGVNSGHLAYVVTLPARDGLVVASVDAAQLASQMASASAAWTGAAATASGAASHFGALAKRGSARSRASAKRARAAWLAVAKQARPAATACGAARDALASSRVKAPGLVQSAATASAAAVAGAKVSLKLRAASQASAAATQARAADALVRGVYSSAR